MLRHQLTTSRLVDSLCLLLRLEFRRARPTRSIIVAHDRRIVFTNGWWPGAKESKIDGDPVYE